jgi:hypothetical protein
MGKFTSNCDRLRSELRRTQKLPLKGPKSSLRIRQLQSTVETETIHRPILNLGLVATPARGIIF